MLSGVEILTWLKASPGNMLPPLLLSLVMAVGDIKSRRIPNYLTMGGALGGLLFQVIMQGWSGLIQGGEGLGLGLVLLIIPYLMGGVGAGDVKALAALGAWLGPGRLISLFIYMSLAGGVLSLAVMLFRGNLLTHLREGWVWLLNLILSKEKIVDFSGEGKKAPIVSGIPYAVAIALGMVGLILFGSFL